MKINDPEIRKKYALFLVYLNELDILKDDIHKAYDLVIQDFNKETEKISKVIGNKPITFRLDSFKPINSNYKFRAYSKSFFFTFKQAMDEGFRIINLIQDQLLEKSSSRIGKVDKDGFYTNFFRNVKTFNWKDKEFKLFFEVNISIFILARNIRNRIKRFGSIKFTIDSKEGLFMKAYLDTFNDPSLKLLEGYSNHQFIRLKKEFPEAHINSLIKFSDLIIKYIEVDLNNDWRVL
jgi:hypothetical protein